MFQKIIKSIKEIATNLDEEEKFMLGSSVGLVFLGFLIYSLWQTRFEEPQEDPIAEVEENIEDEEEEVEIEEEDNSYENTTHGYEIVDIGNEITEIDQVRVFGLREPSRFIVDYKDIVHAVFENENNLSVEEWVEEKIEEKGPRDESFEEQKSFLDIVLKREVSTPLGNGIEVVRMNGTQSGELFVSRDGYIMTFIYQVESAREVSSMESKRDKLIESIN